MPVLASLLLRKPAEKEPLLFRVAKRVYVPALDRCLARPFRVAAAAVAVFAVSLGIAPFLGAEFIPRLDEGAIAMQIWRLPSISLEKSNEISTEGGAHRDGVPARSRRWCPAPDAPEIATDPMGVEISDTYLILKPRDTWRFGPRTS